MSLDAKLQNLPDADVSYLPKLKLPEANDVCFERLRDETPWAQQTIKMFGREVMQPRLVCWMGDPDAVYRYSGRTQSPHPWTDLMQALRAAVEKAARAQFNGVLMNYYRDHRDGMGLHADNEKPLGPEPVIASLSFGAARLFQLRHKTRKDLRCDLTLEDGSLLLMRGVTQQHWKHAAPKRAKPCGPRINLTFRNVLYPAA